MLKGIRVLLVISFFLLSKTIIAQHIKGIIYIDGNPDTIHTGIVLLKNRLNDKIMFSEIKKGAFDFNHLNTGKYSIYFYVKGCKIRIDSIFISDNLNEVIYLISQLKSVLNKELFIDKSFDFIDDQFNIWKISYEIKNKLTVINDSTGYKIRYLGSTMESYKLNWMGYSKDQCIEQLINTDINNNEIANNVLKMFQISKEGRTSFEDKMKEIRIKYTKNDTIINKQNCTYFKYKIFNYSCVVYFRGNNPYYYYSNTFFSFDKIDSCFNSYVFVIRSIIHDKINKNLSYERYGLQDELGVSGHGFWFYNKSNFVSEDKGFFVSYRILREKTKSTDVSFEDLHRNYFMEIKFVY